MNGIFAFIFVFTIVGAFVLIPRAIRHDRLLDAEEYDAFTEGQDDRFTTDNSAWLKGES